MREELAEVEFQRFWRRLQQLGLNAYEARSYLVLLGHPRFKALELAARAHVPRQKIYEVLDSLVEKGFAQVVQEKTKLFSAVEPNLAIPGYIARRRQLMEHELMDHGRTGVALADDLNAATDLRQTKLYGLMKGKGYAFASASLNVFGNNCQDITAAAAVHLDQQSLWSRLRAERTQ
jgi:sugar-specific transcriptional regulator TrmB